MTTNTSPYNKIIIAVDFSASSKQVAERALELTRDNEAELILLHATEYLSPLSFGDEPMPSPDWILLEDQLDKHAEISLAAFANEMNMDDAEQLTPRGSADHEIVTVATERAADLIIVGAHGRRGLQRLLGSTATSVIHRAPCDVLAVRVQS